MACEYSDKPVSWPGSDPAPGDIPASGLTGGGVPFAIEGSALAAWLAGAVSVGAVVSGLTVGGAELEADVVFVGCARISSREGFSAGGGGETWLAPEPPNCSPNQISPSPNTR